MIRLSIREATHADRATVAFSFAHLGAKSRYQRFLTERPVLTARELERLIAVDHWHRETLIAFAYPPRTPAGVAEYVRLDSFDVAEVAVAVVDRWQRHGVGQALLEALRARALAAGIRHFDASLLRDNRGALALARGFGPYSVRAAQHAMVELTVDL